jgi:hypothetical protein
MSVCRWSSDDYRCDLYIYESADGYVTHVAARRLVDDIPAAPSSLLMTDPAAFAEAHQAQTEALNDATRVAMGGPCDGEMFVDETADELRQRLEHLRSVGYRFPDSVYTGFGDD